MYESQRVTSTVALAIVLLLRAALPPSAAADDVTMRAVRDRDTGQIDLVEGDRRVLRYNYRTVGPPAGTLEKVNAGSRKYARPRSNYIHPLHGLDGVELTKDWSIDHPHHRGIYWAWPEVGFRGQLGDLHALQRVFARPTGKVALRTGEDWAEVEAENRWLWEDKAPIVHEVTTTRAWRSGTHGRFVDLTFRFTALEDGVTLARRGTKHYGGLNLRGAPIAGLKLVHHADAPDATPRRAWQAATGTWKGAKQVATLALFESATNPGFPGDYVEYPALSWFQATFPRAGTRHALKKGAPLVLRYRLWIRAGVATEGELAEQWTRYQKTEKPAKPAASSDPAPPATSDNQRGES